MSSTIAPKLWRGTEVFLGLGRLLLLATAKLLRVLWPEIVILLIFVRSENPELK
ncbi:MAG UNVERIFIED_CONTAM: hypothetical protein LVR29_11095 [Microcystis novacekii LVE1205-3]